MLSAIINPVVNLTSFSRVSELHAKRTSLNISSIALAYQGGLFGDYYANPLTSAFPASILLIAWDVSSLQTEIVMS